MRYHGNQYFNKWLLVYILRKENVTILPILPKIGNIDTILSFFAIPLFRAAIAARGSEGDRREFLC